MLQRAADNAYSWWWASHIRTKQSKWLDNNLQDMEVKVQDILKLIEEDGDSFAQKAEMYYRKRPELINFVEEFYRAYRSLAERYDHISGELHKANNTIATVFPDQLQLTMEDEDDFDSPKVTATHSNKVHKALTKDSGKKLINKDMTCPPPPVMQRPTRTSPQVDKEKAQEEIDQLQKEILVLQTEKEFVKSCYESNLTKYWDIEKRITEMQHKVCLLQDDFSISIVIEDDEARALMAATALRSCEDTLRNLHEEQKRFIEEARMESERIKSAKEKLKVLKGEQSPSTFHEPPKESTDQGTNATDLIVEASGLKQEKLELRSVCAKIKQCIEMPSDISIEVLAEKIDELVDKVISLEATVSSQMAHIRKLRLETDELYKHLQILEEEKSSLSDDSRSLGDKLRNAEKELCRLQHLDKSFQDESHKIQIHFTETCSNFNDLSEKFQSTYEVGDINTLGSNQAETVHNFNDLPGILKPAESTDDANVLGSNQAEVVHNLYSHSKILQSTREAGNVTAPPNQGIVHSFNGFSEKLPFVDEAGDIIVEGSNQIDVVHNLKDHSEKSQSNDDVTIFRLMQVETVCNASSPGKPNNQEDKTPCDELNNSLDDWAKEVFHARPQPDFFPNDQHMDTDWEANFVPNRPSKMHPKENHEDDKKTIYASDDINQQLAKPQGDDTGDTNFIPNKFTACLAVPEQQVLVGKTIHIPNAENQQEDQAKLHYVQATESDLDDERGMQTVDQDDSPNWQKLLLDGLDDREKVLLAEYTSILRNYKDIKRKYSEAENKHQEYLFETMSKIRDLKNSVAMKDEEIRSLRQKLHFFEANPSDILDVSLPESKHLQFPLRTESIQKKQFSLFSSFKMLENHESSHILNGENTEPQPTRVVNGSYEENCAESPLAIKLQALDEPETTSAIEEKFRRDIDELLEQNLEFWLRFSSSFQQIQKLQTAFQKLQGEISKLKDTKKQEGGSVSSTTSSGELSVKLEATPLHKLLRDLQNDMSIWLDQNAQLKVELQCRFASLCNIKDEITKVSTENPASENEGVQLTAYQAAKFHGEVLNMQQENNKVADELETGTDHIKGLLADVEQTIAKLNQNYEISTSAKAHTPLYNFRHFSSRTRIPLRSFLFGVKSRPKKPSIFSCMNPALQKQYSDMTAAIPP